MNNEQTHNRHDITPYIAAASTHWYKVTGEPIYEVPLKKPVKEADGSIRATTPTTLRQARQMALLPSFSAIKGLVGNPQLEAWKVRQALSFGASHADMKPEALQLAWDEESSKASARGTVLHAYIDRYVMFGQWPKIEEDAAAFRAIEMIESHKAAGASSRSTEICLADKAKGYAGKLDFLGTWDGEEVLIDWKTVQKDRKPYETEGWQGAVYLDLLGETRPFLNVYISQESGEILNIHRWKPESLAEGLVKFRAIFEAWCVLKKYDPRTAVAQEEKE